MDDAEFQRLLAATLPPQPKAPPAAEAAPAAPEAAAPQPQPDATPQSTAPAPAFIPHNLEDLVRGGPAPSPPGAPTSTVTVGPGEPATMDPLTNAIDAAGVGAAKSVLATKDFLFGRPPEDEKSTLRQSIESTGEALDNQSPAYGFISGLSQFVTGMIGAGKIVKGLSLVPKLGEAVTAAGDAIESGGKLARGAAEAVKAAAVGSVVFDPHDQRLSNLIESFPALSNPITRFLMAKPDDSDAEERLKGALESLGLDATLGPVLAGGLKVYKALRGGDREAAAKAADEVTEASQAHEDAKVLAPTSEEQATAPTGTASPAGEGQAAPVSVAEAGSSKPPETSASAAAESVERPDTVGTEEPAESVGAQGSGAKPEEPRSTEATPAPASSRWSPANIPTADVEAIAKGMAGDASAIEAAGSWDAAVADGHVFGRGEGIPWQKLGTVSTGDPSSMTDAFVARVADAIKPQVDAAKGGDVLSDAHVQAMVAQRASLFGEDPQSLLGAIHQAGRDANTMVANMEAGYLVAQRSLQDAWALAARINAGVLDDFGGDKEAAIVALKDRLRFAATAYAGARSITAAAGRSLRRMRGEFRLDPQDVAALDHMDGDCLAYLLANSNGDPRSLVEIANPSVWRRMADWGNFIVANNMLWGWKTAITNAVTNGYMTASRPAERILGVAVLRTLRGGEGGETAETVRRESLRQYLYMGAALSDAFRAGKKAFFLGDSPLAPRSTERYGVGGQIGAPGTAPFQFRPVENWQALLYNALLVASAPTRSMGFADEIAKQVTYRSLVMAQAAIQGEDRGLAGADLTQFVERELRESFDANGAGTNAAALQEAKIVTFSQDLLPKTAGRTVQAATMAHPALRLVLPFVKTPTNIFRYGVKLTPVLDLLQREYRDMLSGKLGEAAQIQAVGQMSMGALFMGALGFASAQGWVTGAGPADSRLLAQLKATGWQPYSFVHHNADGSAAYTPFDPYQPATTPYGIIADLQDALHVFFTSRDEAGAESVGDTSMALLLGVVKHMTNQSYLFNAAAVLDGLSQPAHRLAGAAGHLAANLIPASSLLREVNPDPYLRDARTVTDRVMASVPGLSAHLPPRYDLWGDPITVRRGLWSSVNDSIVDQEYDRMASLGQAPTPPAASLGDGVDLRDITMADGRNAYTAYQELSGRIGGKQDSLKDAAAALIKSPAYQGAPDGPLDVRGTRAWELHGLIMRYRNVAMRIIKADPNVRAKMLEARLKVAGAYASKQADPEGAHAQAQALQKMGERFGVDLDALTHPARRK